MKKKYFILFIFFCFVKILANSRVASNSEFIKSQFNTTPLMNAVEADDVKAVGLLLNNGLDPDARNIAGVSALHIAAKNNCFNAAEVLIKSKATIDIFDDELFTPLMRAVMNNSQEMVNLLVNNNANICQTNIFDENAITLAVQSNCIKCLETIKLKIEKQKNKEIYIKCTRNFNKLINIVSRKENEKMKKLLIDIYSQISNIPKKQLEKQFEIVNTVGQNKNLPSFSESTINDFSQPQNITQKAKQNQDNVYQNDILSESKNKNTKNNKTTLTQETKYLINKIYVFTGESKNYDLIDLNINKKK